MSEIRVPVLIVGGGGAGLTSSIFLSSHGIDHLLVERHEGTSVLPKAHYLNQRFMEIMRQHNVADAVYAGGAPLAQMGKVAWYTSLSGDGPLDAKTFAKMDAFGGGETTERYLKDSPCRSTNFPQLRLEPVLKQIAADRAPGRVLFHHELTDVTQDADGVTATILNRTTGDTMTVRSDYLVAADGGKTIGETIGATMVGPKNLIDIVSTHFTADLSPWWDDEVLIAHFTNPESGAYPAGGNLVPLGPTWGKHSEEWQFHFAYLPTDETHLSPDFLVPKIRELLKVGDLDITVNKTSHWMVEGSIASKFQEGRIFLVGDAAHKHPPTTGLGLNTCVQDAHNLAWKLAAVLKGQAAPELLDTYQAERLPVAMRVVDWALFSLQNHFVVDAGIGMMPIPLPPEMHQAILGVFFSDTPMGESRRARFNEAVATQRVEFQAHDLEIGYSYPVGAVVADGSTPPPTDPMGSIYHPTSRPGHRLPHAWLEHDGQRLSTHDIVGATGEFTLITGSANAAWKAVAAEASEKFGIGIQVAAIGSDYADADGQWAEVRGIGDDGAILVRPDNIVGWRSADATDAAVHSFVGAVGTILGH
ncbi:FAD-dependent monooxygenase [Rhodococcus sp. USK13]|uniref:FAD-dependent monooxygenase n=1 Tax=Rhodococcus sp. USK13 TaxID=2806442 RepID=UPI001BCDF6F4|nr:FAD-dependent monooxygenase [Rhodococcus sp. USK13]